MKISKKKVQASEAVVSESAEIKARKDASDHIWKAIKALGAVAKDKNAVFAKEAICNLSVILFDIKQ